MRKDKVTPGDELGVIEEFIEGEGVYEDYRGTLRSIYVGRTFYDMVRRTANVIPAKRAKIPRPGDIVIGVVTAMKPDMVILDLYGKLSSPGKLNVIEEFSGTMTGLLPINLVAQEYVKDIYDYFSIGDIVIAQVTGNRNPFQLTTKKPIYGVIFSLCPECNNPLQIKNERLMVCPICGRTVKKKVALFRNPSKLLHGLKRMISFYIY